MIEICRERTNAGEILGEPCRLCGHTNVVHPGVINPALTECVLCRLLDGVEQASHEP